MGVRPIIGLMMIASLLQACSPPKGPDLVDVTCQCFDSFSGSTGLVSGRVCTTATDPAAVSDASKKLCSGKDTKCIGCISKIEGCHPVGVGTSVTVGGCPNGSSERAGGDFGQASATAVAPSRIDVSGSDIVPFSITPAILTVHTTQTGSVLLFADMEGTLSDITFQAAGIFGASDHTLAEGRMILTEAFSIPLQPDGRFVIPDGTAAFIVTGVLDGDRVALKGTAQQLAGLYDEEIGLFDLSGTVKADGADITLQVHVTFKFANRPPRADAGPDQTVECSSQARLARVHLSGADSTDFDGNDDIQTFVWFVDTTDPSQGTSGEDLDVDLSLGSHSATLVVADRANSFSEDTVTITVQDSTPPGIQIAQPAPVEYPHSATLTLAYAVDDGCTGVSQVTPRLDGALTLAGHGLLSGQAINLLTELELGPHTFNITTIDNAGNRSSSTVTFIIIATTDSLKEAIRQFFANGAIKNQGVKNSLQSKIDSAAAAQSRGQCAVASNILQAFLNELKAQSGNGVSTRAAEILTKDAQYVMGHCS